MTAKRPWEETWKRMANDVVARPRGRVLTAVRLYPSDDANLDLASAAPDMARALLDCGSEVNGRWHTNDCINNAGDGQDGCSEGCHNARSALSKAGVPLP